MRELPHPGATRETTTDSVAQVDDGADAVAPGAARQPSSTIGRLRAARNEQGLTTLEWLLIVAAVAGLAVVAVVLVTNVVNQTADQLASANPSVAAAQESARSVIDQIAGQNPTAPLDADAQRNFRSRCNRVRTSFGTSVDVFALVGGTGTPAGVPILGHSLSDNLGDATMWAAAVEGWIAGGTSDPAVGSTNNRQYIGCFVRQKPTP